MRKIIFFYNCKARYYSSFPIINNFRILYHFYDEFKKYKVEPIPFVRFTKEKDNNQVQWEFGYDKMLLLLDEGIEGMLNEFQNNSGIYRKAIILCFHPVCYEKILARMDEIKAFNLGIKFVLWQDDLHAYFKNGMRGEVLQKLDCIISPSPVFFKNIKTDLSKKTRFFFYSMDFDIVDKHYKEWDERDNKILLSGSCNRGYPLRHKLLSIIKSGGEISPTCAYLKRPRIKEYNRPVGTYFPVGENYYDKLCQYRGAFFAYYEFPKNFNLAKIIEILACGCLGFFEKSDLLMEELGLKEFEHYVPITKDGVLIEDLEYYNKWMSGEEGKKIAENGRRFVRKHFSNQNGFLNYIKILKKL